MLIPSSRVFFKNIIWPFFQQNSRLVGASQNPKQLCIQKISKLGKTQKATKWCGHTMRRCKKIEKTPTHNLRGENSGQNSGSFFGPIAMINAIIEGTHSSKHCYSNHTANIYYWFPSKKRIQSNWPFYTILKWNIAMFSVDSCPFLVSEKVQVPADSLSGGMWFDDVVNETCK